jgi:hypothetical protein
MVRTQGSWRGGRYLLRDVALRLARRQLAKGLMSETLAQGVSPPVSVGTSSTGPGTHTVAWEQFFACAR